MRVLFLTLLTIVALFAKDPSNSNEEKPPYKGLDTNPIVVLETNQGDIEIELWPVIAPKAVENFETHVKNGYYNGTIFHRVIKGFMIQGGDPKSNGTGGESIWGKPFEDEFRDDVRFNKRGLLAMANRGPKTNGSQFFITTGTPYWLNKKHTIFGRVIKGMKVVDKIEDTRTPNFGKPPYRRDNIKGDIPINKQEIIKAYIKKQDK